jgi:uncharacterized membrane protein (DUF373 family)
MDRECIGGVARVRTAVAWVRGHVVSIVIDVLVMLVLVALVRAVVGLTLEMWHVVSGAEADGFKTVTTQMLTVFVFIEIFHSLMDYIEHQRVRVTHLADASLAFVLREVWVALYSGVSGWQWIAALAVLVVALGAVRTLAVVFSPAAELAE